VALDAIHDEVNAALTRVREKDPELASAIDEAHGYAVFPSAGRASAVLGGAFGRGEVFERGERIGGASMGQLTLGVQLGGQTFSEIVVFKSENALDRFKAGRLAFAGNLSAVVSKVSAAGTADYERDVIVKVYSRGGMLLEASLGGQYFKFKPSRGDGDASRSKDESTIREGAPSEGDAAE
jgi:lipid-binding SYLF domain-containing protein